MIDPQLKVAIFEFEDVSPELDTLPIAARRALDHAGLRLSLQGFRALSLEERRRLILAGVEEIIDVGRVSSVVRRAQPPAQAVDPVGDPDPLVPPSPIVGAEGATRWIDPSAWSRLRSLDRYALAHEHRRGIARSDAARYAAACKLLLGATAPEAPRARPAPPRGPSVIPPAPPAPTQLSAVDGEADEAMGRYASVTPRGMVWPDGGGRTPPPHRWPEGRAPSRSALPPSMEVPREAPRESAREAPRDASRGLSPPVSQARREGSVLPPGNPLAPRREGSLPPPAPAPARMARPSPPPVHRDDEATRAISTHVMPSGEVHMVDVQKKPESQRRAVASGAVRMRSETLSRIQSRDVAKGEVLATARIAGIMAAKRTPELIPLCHSVRVTSVAVDIDLDPVKGRALVTAIVDAFDRTGVEMEALTAVSVACLTMYDMLKGVDKDLVIEDIKLLEKSGGRSGDYTRRDA